MAVWQETVIFVFFYVLTHKKKKLGMKRRRRLAKYALKYIPVSTDLCYSNDHTPTFANN